MNILTAVLYVIFAPIVGGLLNGFDRRISARMQGRQGPPILQPFYDVLKLFEKENSKVNNFQNFYIICFLVFLVFTGILFFAGGDILLVIFALTVAGIFFVIGGYSSNSPYSFLGAERELLQMMAYEPMVLICAVGFFIVSKSFNVSDIFLSNQPLIYSLPLIFLGLIYVLTIKFRKSPFDLSTSHHGHQELVKGITTEYSGRTLAFIEISHWYENILMFGFVYLFFSWNSILSPFIAVGACLVIYFFEILIDNTFARVKWQLTLSSAWIVSLILGGINIAYLFFIK
jgi:ech hydrogenase subunit B